MQVILIHYLEVSDLQQLIYVLSMWTLKPFVYKSTPRICLWNEEKVKCLCTLVDLSN